ncbi:MAG: branched-chain amino acid ABC transporter permease, partial [Candidatus Tectomicrobia bacterium]
MLDPYTESVFTNIGINIVMTLSMYLPLAVGQLSIAQVAFMAIGAHVATVLTLYLDVPFGLALLAAGFAPWLVGVLLGWLTLRLQGLHFALATFAFMEVVQVFFLNFTPTGDARGIKGIAPLRLKMRATKRRVRMPPDRNGVLSATPGEASFTVRVSPSCENFS